MPRISKKMQMLKEMFDEELILEYEIENYDFNTLFIDSLYDNLSYICDERMDGYVLHSIESIILSTIFALMANCNTFAEIEMFIQHHYKWLLKYINFEAGIPSVSTIRRVIGLINPIELENICNEVFNKYLKTNEPIYKSYYIEINDIKSMDGKTANSSSRESSKTGKISKMNAMSLYSYKDDICEATEFINEKTNEIPTGPQLLSKVDIKNSIIVFDALSTQKETIKYIIENKAHYVAPIKGNQKTIFEALIDYFNDKEFLEKAKKEAYFVEKEKTNGAEDKREYIFTTDVDWLVEKSSWKNLTSIGCVKRTYKNSKGIEVLDTRYYISDLESKYIGLIAKSIRGEWSIENGLHRYLDVVFQEDKNRSFLKNSQKNLNIIRKFCLGILKHYKESTKLSMHSVRFAISMDFENRIKDVLNSLQKKSSK